MQKFGLLSRKLTEISRFKNLVKLRFHVTSVYKNSHNLLNFEANRTHLLHASLILLEEKIIFWELGRRRIC